MGRSLKYVLDTHCLLWWTLDPIHLSPKVAKLSERFATEGVAVSSISIWELGIKIKNGKLSLGFPIEKYVQKLHELGGVKIIPVDEQLWMQNLSLNWAHKDPADRTIVATAKSLKLPIVTKDKAIRQFYKKSIW